MTGTSSSTTTAQTATTAKLSLDAPIEDLGLSVGAYNPLKSRGINVVAELLQLSQVVVLQMLSAQHGRRQLDEIVDKLALFGYELAPEA